MMFGWDDLLLAVAPTVVDELFGDDESSASKAQGDLAAAMAGQYRNYVPQVNSLLWEIIQHPERDPAYQAQMFDAMDDADTYYRQAASELGAQLARSGMGKPGESSLANALLLNLNKDKASQLAKLRVGQLGDMDARRMRAITALLGGTVQGAGAGLSGLGQQAMRQDAAQSEMQQAIAALAGELGYGRGGGSGGNSGGGMVNTDLTGSLIASALNRNAPGQGINLGSNLGAATELETATKYKPKAPSTYSLGVRF